jgi:hypothetical protein
MPNAASWAKQARPKLQQAARTGYPTPDHYRRAFHHPKTSLGAAGHWIHLLSVAAPLIIPEVIEDPDKRWRAMRLASVGAALASEAVWTHKLSQDRKREEECHAAAQGADR